jgi:segregation and condensation protein B
MNHDVKEPLTEGYTPAQDTSVEPEGSGDVEQNPLDTVPEQATVESVVEAVLFASDEAVTLTKLAGITEATTGHIKECVDNLNAKYEKGGHAFRIETIAGGFQMLTQPHFNHWLRRLLRVRSDTKLSAAALETLAVVAYKQPVMRADIEAIRGVSSGEVLRNLMYKGLVKIIGRAEIVGRPMLYGTTKKFLTVFGLNTLKDLPSIEELKEPQDKPKVSSTITDIPGQVKEQEAIAEETPSAESPT